MQALSEERFSIVRDELKEAWIARMKLLLEKIEGKTILLWFADRAPEDVTDAGGLGRDPLFVDRRMIEAIRPYVTEVVELVASDAALAQGTKGCCSPRWKSPAAHELMGPVAHEEAAQALLEPLSRLI